MRRRPSDRIALAALVLCACPLDPDCGGEGLYTSESGRWWFVTDSLAYDPCDNPGVSGGSPPEHLLPGTTWCPEVQCMDSPGCDFAELPCHDLTIDGPATHDDGCLTFTAAGPVTLRLAPKACDEPGVVAETFAFTVADPAAVRGRLVPLGDHAALAALTAPDGPFPPGLTPGPDATILKIVAGATTTAAVLLETADARVAWPIDQVEITVDVRAGAAPTVVFTDSTTLVISAPPGSDADLAFAFAGASIPLGRVVAVDPNDLTDLDVVVGFLDDGMDRFPLGARAVVRDGDGDLVYGAPVAWSVDDGAFPLEPASATLDADRDYVLFHDLDAEHTLSVCYTAPLFGSTEFHGRVSARYAGLGDGADFSWTVRAAEDDKQAPFTDPSPKCEGPGFSAGCGCTAAPRRADLLAPLLLLLAARRRRR